VEPSYYNAAVDLLERSLRPDRAGRVAFLDESGSHTYGELAERANRCANALRELGIQPEQRVLLCLYDSIDFPACFLGAIKAGIVPVPINTMWSADDYAYIFRDSRARAVIASEGQLAVIRRRWRSADGRERSSLRDTVEAPIANLQP
jgi:acyl-CoA synthetase (AMP-forming)/AMP-acid ligase II